jgi:hypothetical protein
MHLRQNSTAQNADGTINLFMRLTWVDLCKLLQLHQVVGFCSDLHQKLRMLSTLPAVPPAPHHADARPLPKKKRSATFSDSTGSSTIIYPHKASTRCARPGAVPPCTPNSQHHACAQYVLSTCTAGFVYRIFVPETPNKSIPGTLERPKPTRNRHKTDTIYRGSAQSTLLSGHCDEWCTIVS